MKSASIHCFEINTAKKINCSLLLITLVLSISTQQEAFSQEHAPNDAANPSHRKTSSPGGIGFQPTSKIMSQQNADSDPIKSESSLYPSNKNQSELNSPAPSRNFSLSASFERAERENKELTVSRKGLPIAAAAIKIAGAIPNPQFQAQLGFGPSFYHLFTGQTQQIGYTQQFQTAAKRSKKVEVAKANYVLAQNQLDALRFDVHNRVRRAYAELTASEAYQALVEAQREVGLRLAEIAKKRVDAGKAAATEYMQANLNVQQFDTLRNQAKGRLQQASAALALLTGERPEKIEVIDVDDCGIFRLSTEKTDIVPSPQRTLPALNQLLATAFETRPDLRSAKQQVQVNEKAVALAKAQRVPDLFVGSGYTFATFVKHQPVQLVAEPNWLGNGVFVTVSSELPVLYQHQGEVLLAKANLRQSEKQVDLLKSQIAADVITAYTQIEVTKENISIFQNELLPTSAEVSRIARLGYQVGSSDLPAAIVAQQQYQQTLSAYFDAVSAYQTAWADLEKAVGAPLKL